MLDRFLNSFRGEQNRTIRKGIVDAALAGAGVVVGIIAKAVADLDGDLSIAIGGLTAAGFATLRRILRDWQDGQPE